MTISELRAHPEYTRCMNKIKNYRPGFQFTMNFSTIPTTKANALRIVLRDAKFAGYLECMSIGLDIHGNPVEETYLRTCKKGE